MSERKFLKGKEKENSAHANGPRKINIGLINMTLYDNKKFSDISEKELNEIFQSEDPTYWQQVGEEDFKDNKKAYYTLISKLLMLDYHFVCVTDTEGIRDDLFIYNHLRGIYQPDGIRHIKEQVSIFNPDTSRNAMKEIIEKVKIKNYQLDPFNKLNKITCLNGTLNLDTFELEDHDYTNYITRSIPVHHDPTVEGIEAKNFLYDISANNEEMVKTLLEIIADCLCNHYKSQKMHMLVGKGQNGKGKFLGLITAFLGKENLSGLSLFQIAENFKTYLLASRLANVAGDISKKYFTETGVIKQCRGEDLIVGDRKNREPITFYNTAKMIFSCQEVPATNDDTHGWYRSWNILRFIVCFDGDKKNPNILSKITTTNELTGLLNLVLEAGKRLKTNNYEFTADMGLTREQIKKNYLFNSNPIVAFVEERVAFDNETETEKKEVYEAFLSFCEKHDLTVSNESVFWKQIRKLGQIRTTRPRVMGQKIYCVFGLRILEEEENDDNTEEEEKTKNPSDLTSWTSRTSRTKQIPLHARKCSLKGKEGEKYVHNGNSLDHPVQLDQNTNIGSIQWDFDLIKEILMTDARTEPMELERLKSLYSSFNGTALKDLNTIEETALKVLIFEGIIMEPRPQEYLWIGENNDE